MRPRHRLCILLLLVGMPLARVQAGPPAEDADWAVYNGHANGDHYSALADITPGNVHGLKEAWRMVWPEPGDPGTNPLVVDGVLYGYTPSLKVVALQASTGRLLWSFDAGLKGSLLAPGVHFTGPARGLTLWRHGKERRLFAGVMQYLFALDPLTGQPMAGFGQNGAIDLREGLRGPAAGHYVALTSPGVVFGDLIIVGFRTTEVSPAPPGDIRAFDVRTGRLRWRFHTIPHTGEYGSQSWPAGAWRTAGGANDWAGMALDESSGVLYVPTGSAVSGFYGADRTGDDLFSDTLLALDARTGRRLWHFQGVHHDLWDRDFPAPPSLLDVHRGGRTLAAVAQATKQGDLFVFDRRTGKPLFPIRELPYPASTVPGEHSAPTQPRPELPEPFARQRLEEALLTDRTEAAHEWAVAQFRTFRSGGPFVPVAVGQPTVVFPGFDGGAEWGGTAVDRTRGILYVNSNDVAWTGALVPTVRGGGIGSALYGQNCASCHGSERGGSPPTIPSLKDVAGRLNEQQIAAVILGGRGRMPPFPNLHSFALPALIHFVLTGSDDTQIQDDGGALNQGRSDMTVSLAEDSAPAPYRFAGHVKFLDPDGYPAVKPPWGTLNAIDLNDGHYLWKVPLGSYPELASLGRSDTGSENYGGPVLTASGLLFIGATIYDRKLHAFDSRTGKLLWEADLPFSGTATPAIYRADGRQYIVICMSNARTREAPQGGGYIAFALDQASGDFHDLPITAHDHAARALHVRVGAGPRSRRIEHEDPCHSGGIPPAAGNCRGSLFP